MNQRIELTTVGPNRPASHSVVTPDRANLDELNAESDCEMLPKDFHHLHIKNVTALRRDDGKSLAGPHVDSLEIGFGTEEKGVEKRSLSISDTQKLSEDDRLG